jgi:predicted dinucleotide-binding enzyme
MTPATRPPAGVTEARLGDANDGYHTAPSGGLSGRSMRDSFRKARKLAATIDEAASFGRVVIAALPFGHVRALPAASIGDRILIDATNYFRGRDGAIRSLEQGETTSSEMVAAYANDARVVKAFNTIQWEELRDEARPAGEHRRALPIAGDDADAKKIVADLIDEIGFDTVDAGPLAAGRALQPGSDLFLGRLTRDELRRRVR